MKLLFKAVVIIMLLREPQMATKLPNELPSKCIMIVVN